MVLLWGGVEALVREKKKPAVRSSAQIVNPSMYRVDESPILSQFQGIITSKFKCIHALLTVR